MKQTLPWESVPPPIFTAQAFKPRKKWVSVGGWVLVAFLLIYGLTAQSRNPLVATVSLLFALLYTLTMLTKKDAVLTNRGLEIFYNMQITTHYDFFPWEQINAIVTEDRGHADYVRLHIGYSSMEKALFFKRSEVAAICKFAKEKNPAIRVMDYDTSRPEKPAKQKKRK